MSEIVKVLYQSEMVDAIEVKPIQGERLNVVIPLLLEDGTTLKLDCTFHSIFKLKDILDVDDNPIYIALMTTCVTAEKR